MASKKYTAAMVGLLGLISTASFAQTPGTYSSADDSWLYDSSKVSSSGLAQQNDFKNHVSPYPARPRDMWELGIGVGPTFMFTPINPRLGEGASISLRKSLGHIFSVRAQYNYGIYYGRDFRVRNVGKYAPMYLWNTLGGQGASYLANFKATIQQASIDGIFSLNTISGYRGNPKVEWYVLGGYSFTWGSSRGNFLNSSNQPYAWSSLPDNTRIDKSTIKSTLTSGQSNGIFTMKAGQDQQYETEITNRNGAHDNVVGGGGYAGGNIIRHGADFGGGVSFKVSPRFNIGVEQKFTYLFDNGDYAGVITGPTQRGDLLSNTQVRFNFNLGSSAKRVEPLWWINPNNYVYTQLAKRLILPDADGDGVTDQFDLEPNTPAGAPVDTHGRALDTDGDGVPDYRDKEVLTPQKWFPVDANGVGTEPEPACCKELRDKLANFKPAAECAVTSLPSVKFKGGKAKLSKDAETTLASVASQLNANTSCKVKIVAYGASNKRAQQLSWERGQAVGKYLVEKQGIADNRIIFIYGQDGAADTVDLQPTTEDGQGLNAVPAPHPNLK